MPDQQAQSEAESLMDPVAHLDDQVQAVQLHQDPLVPWVNLLVLRVRVRSQFDHWEGVFHLGSLREQFRWAWLQARVAWAHFVLVQWELVEPELVEPEAFAALEAEVAAPVALVLAPVAPAEQQPLAALRLAWARHRPTHPCQ